VPNRRLYYRRVVGNFVYSLWVGPTEGGGCAMRVFPFLLLIGIADSQCTVSTLAGQVSAPSGSYLEGVGTSARFSDPRGVAVDAGGYQLFVADAGNARVRAVVLATGATSVISGNGTQTSANGVGTFAAHARPYALAGPGAAGLLYVTDRSSGRIRRVNVATRVVTTIAGSGIISRVDGFGTPTFTATFSAPSGLFLDEASNALYVADCIASSTFSALVRKIDLGTMQVSTLAGSSAAGSASYLDGVYVPPRPNAPENRDTSSRTLTPHP
jgi:DNA-binding beta-propeller fold protein YncE